MGKGTNSALADTSSEMSEQLGSWKLVRLKERSGGGGGRTGGGDGGGEGSLFHDHERSRRRLQPHDIRAPV